ncbi:MAG: MCE family protein [Acetobacteraceae bacterium]|nr:MCE family protein [Acetobacteraceae bacterium]
MSDIGEIQTLSESRVRRSRRVSALWLIPLVAVVIGAWLAWDTLSKQGPTIAISFESAEGLQAGQSQLKFKELVLGTVKSLDLTSDHKRVVATVATTHQATPLLLDNTEFWVVKPRLFAGNISGLETLLSGAYIGMRPSEAPGKHQTKFVGREVPPVLEADVPGRTFLLKADRIGSISLGSPVYYRDINVGEVLGWDFSDMAEHVTIRAFIRQPFDSYVRDDTRFWNASGVSIKLGGAGVQVQVESLKAVLLGGIAFETPMSKSPGETSVADHVFPLFEDRAAANNASYRRKIPLVSYFSGSVRGLEPGGEVTTHGLLVGHVTDVQLSYDHTKDRVLAPVHYEIEPERILGIGAKSFYPSTADAVEDLVKRGFRATLQSSSLITGQQMISIEVLPDAPPATVSLEGSDFVMPTAPGGGFEGLQAAATELLVKVNTIPFDQIGKSLDGILSSANSLASGPQAQQTLADLSAAVHTLDGLLQRVDSGVGPAMRQLPAMTAELQATVANANKLLVSLGNGYGDNTRFNRELERLLMQLNDAVRSIRSLTDMLTRHPEALVKGRPAGGLE